MPRAREKERIKAASNASQTDTRGEMKEEKQIIETRFFLARIYASTRANIKTRENHARGEIREDTSRVSNGRRSWVPPKEYFVRANIAVARRLSSSDMSPNIHSSIRSTGCLSIVQNKKTPLSSHRLH